MWQWKGFFFFLAEFCLGKKNKRNDSYMVKGGSRLWGVWENHVVVLEENLTGNPPRSFRVKSVIHVIPVVYGSNKQNDVIFSLATCLHVRRRGEKKLNKWKKRAGWVSVRVANNMDRDRDGYKWADRSSTRDTHTQRMAFGSRSNVGAL